MLYLSGQEDIFRIGILVRYHESFFEGAIMKSRFSFIVLSAIILSSTSDQHRHTNSGCGV
jgi:hypothetical protein